MSQSAHQLVIVLDFGGQYNQLIARRVRECGVYCEVKSYKTSLDEIKAMNPVGIIFTGGPNSVYAPESPLCSKEIFDMGIPILGICYGCHLMAHLLGGKVSSCIKSEYGKTETYYDKSSVLFGTVTNMPDKAVSWMSHGDYIEKVPDGFKITAHTNDCPTAAMECPEKKLYAVQFHPEVNHTQYGLGFIDSFLRNVCGCVGDWTMSNYAKTAVEDIRKKVGDGKVLLALSGGVDSSVAAALLAKAVGDKLTCI
ncbi:MAG: glutamine-hydrolyzing GMP synthase, partial [Oscillospiraceae bacterium]|nr:glutamine-hydrolyzing GMP synthase [Oscillospiraceae bacterium]